MLLFANASFTCFGTLKSCAVSKRLPLKPLGTQSAVENGLTTPKSSFENDNVTELTLNQ
ncbi:putative lipoprotein [Vibrio parahaemolyticus NIHCB0757]|nr:putative lipoprotein [Vibrio parahaemolyticus NIHCB0757]